MYGPPMSDSDEDDDMYDGFSFNDTYDENGKKKKHKFNATNYKPIETIENRAYDAIIAQDLNKIESIFDEIKSGKTFFNVNAPCYNGLTMLHYACKNGSLEIVSYLINIKKANVHVECCLETPLMSLCSTAKQDDEFEIILNKIGELLLIKGAVINISNPYGMTPLLFACRQGHLGLIKLFIKDASLGAMNNEGRTAIYHAIEGNHLEIVQFLLDYGVDSDVVDNKGYKPVQVAELYGFQDIYKILPKEEVKYEVPLSFYCYNSVHDYIPRIFLKTEVPEYFQEIHSILTKLNLTKYIENFALAGINFNEFLTITDEKLSEIGIEYEFQRDRILLGLLYFHLSHWSIKSISRVKKHDPDNFYDILMLSANHLKNLVIVDSTINYVHQNLKKSQFGKLDLDTFNNLKFNIKGYKEVLNELSKTIKYLQSFRQLKPPLYIDYNDYNLRIKKQNKVKLYFKYSLIIGFSIVVCLRFKNMF